MSERMLTILLLGSVRSQEEFDRKFRIVKDFCITASMTFNINKYELLNLGGVNVISEFAPKTQIKYLGVLINKQWKLTDHFEMLKQDQTHSEPSISDIDKQIATS